MKKITILWITILFVLIITLTLLGLNIAKRKVPYRALENDIVEAMRTYYGQDENLKKLPNKGKSTKILLSELEAYGISINSTINKDKCDGYGIVTGKDVAFTYKSYIKCDKYMTRGYSE